MMNVAVGTVEQAFFVSVWDSRKQVLYGNGSACMAWQNNPTPEFVVNGTECNDS